MAFPEDPQTSFLNAPSEGFAGQRYAIDSNDELLAGIVPVVANVAQQNTVQFNYNGTDDVGIYIDSIGPLFVASNTSDDQTGDDWITAYGQALVNNGTLASLPTNNGSGLVTLVFADYDAHVITEYSPATADVDIATTVAAAKSEEIVFGMGIKRSSSLLDAMTEISQPIALPSAGTDVLAGVVAYTASDNYPNGLASQVGAAQDALIPGKAYQIIRKGRVIVPWVGTLPSKGDAVYWINNPAASADLAKFRADANGGEADLVAGALVEGVITSSNLVKVYFSSPLV